MFGLEITNEMKSVGNTDASAFDGVAEHNVGDSLLAAVAVALHPGHNLLLLLWQAGYEFFEALGT